MGVGRTPAEAQGGAAVWARAPWGDSEEVAVRPRHIFGEHGSELVHWPRSGLLGRSGQMGSATAGQRDLAVPQIVGTYSLALRLPPSSHVSPAWR
jgi:hypothetical protein